MANVRPYVALLRLVQYDGTNGEEVLAALDQNIWSGWSFVSDTDGVLTIRDDSGSEGNRQIETGEYLDVDRHFLVTGRITDASLAGRYVPFTDVQNAV
jgi:hypothetical protein